MTNFLTRLIMRHLGLIPLVEPLIVPMLSPETVAWNNDGLEWEDRSSYLEYSQKKLIVRETQSFSSLQNSVPSETPINQVQLEGKGTTHHQVKETPATDSEEIPSSTQGNIPIDSPFTSDNIEKPQPKNIPGIQPLFSSDTKGSIPQNLSKIASESIPIQTTSETPINQFQSEGKGTTHHQFAETPATASEEIPSSAQGNIPIDSPLASNDVEKQDQKMIPSVKRTENHSLSRVDPLMNQALDLGQQTETTLVDGNENSFQTYPLLSHETGNGVTSSFPNFLQNTPQIIPNSQDSLKSQGLKQEIPTGESSFNLPLVSFSPESKLNPVQPLIQKLPTVQSIQQEIQPEKNYHINSEKSINRKQNSTTPQFREQGQEDTETSRVIPNQIDELERISIANSDQNGRTTKINEDDDKPSAKVTQLSTTSANKPFPIPNTVQRQNFIPLVPLQRRNQKDAEGRSLGERQRMPVPIPTSTNSVGEAQKQGREATLSLHRTQNQPALSPSAKNPQSEHPLQVQPGKQISFLQRSILSQFTSQQSPVSPVTHNAEFRDSNPTHSRQTTNSNLIMGLKSLENTPTIQITIGRVEVRTTQQSTPPSQTKSSKGGRKPALSLQDYLKQRQGGNS